MQAHLPAYQQEVKTHQTENFLLVLISTLGVLAMDIYVFANPIVVAVKKNPPTVDVRSFDSSEPNFASLGPDGAARTSWEFECGSSMQYTFESKQEIGQHWMVRLAIKSVVLTLDLPIVVHLPSNANVRLKQHESGHVEICRSVYENAEQAAREAARSILAKRYNGEGDSIESACRMAVKIASAEIRESYRQRVVEKVNDVSEIYDFLEMNQHAVPRESMEEAFRRFEAGKPRILSNSPEKGIFSIPRNRDLEQIPHK